MKAGYVGMLQSVVAHQILKSSMAPTSRGHQGGGRSRGMSDQGFLSLVVVFALTGVETEKEKHPLFLPLYVIASRTESMKAESLPLQGPQGRFLLQYLFASK